MKRFLKKQKRLSVSFDNEIPEKELEGIVASFKEIFKSAGFQFSDPWQQLKTPLLQFSKLGQPQGSNLQKAPQNPDDLGTAVNVMSMVFGNLGDDCTGVCFTRNPSDGTKELYGEFLINAQGEDVVAGIRTPFPFPAEGCNARNLQRAAGNYHQPRKAYKEMQDIEFTIERASSTCCRPEAENALPVRLSKLPWIWRKKG